MARRAAETGAFGAQPVAVAVDREADPQAVLLVDPVRDLGARPEPGAQLLRDAAAQPVVVERFELVAGLARHDAHALLLGHGLDQRHPVDGVGMDQRRAAQVDKRGNFLRGLERARLQLHGAQGLQPRNHAAQQQQAQQKKSAPEQAHAGPRRPGGHRINRMHRCRHPQLLPSGTNT